MYVLDVGAGPDSNADVQIDIVKFPRTTIVQDAMIEIWKVDSESFDEVRMEQFLEHCPVSIRTFKYNESYPSNMNIIHPRIHCMREAYRVLKHGGILHCSVPGTLEAHFQDPTHEGNMVTEGFFNYFCGQFGSGTPGSFSYESYGIDFKFKKINSFMTGSILTVRLKKE